MTSLKNDLTISATIFQSASSAHASEEANSTSSVDEYFGFEKKSSFSESSTDMQVMTYLNPKSRAARRGISQLWLLRSHGPGRNAIRRQSSVGDRIWISVARMARSASMAVAAALLMQLTVLCIPARAESLEYAIMTTWNNISLAASNAKISIDSSSSTSLVVTAEAVFSNDPVPEGVLSGSNFVGLWDYEVMDLFLANDQDQYIQIELSPYGLFCVLLFDGERQNIRYSLPVDDVEFSFDTDSSGVWYWTTQLTVPTQYIPPNITKFNAYSSHGVGESRVYEAYSPAPRDAAQPDFHNLVYFAPIDLDEVVPDLSSRPMSELWTDAQEGRIRFHIETFWNGTAVEDHDAITVILEGNSDEVILSIDAPFINEDPAPPGQPGHAFVDLFKYEVVEVFFLNAEEQNIEIEIGPYGEHWVLLLWTKDNAYYQLRHSLPLDVVSTITGSRWSATAHIPVEYLPPQVNRFNAFAQHIRGAGRHEESLYPQLDTDSEPDSHDFQYYKSFDMNTIVPGQSELPMSQLWSDSIATPRLFRYSVATEWNSVPITDHQPAEIVLSNEGDSVRMNVTAAFFNDPAPPGGTPGQPFPGLFNYEVVEMFFLNANDEYLEVELGPWGEHLLLLLEGERNTIASELSLDYAVDLRQEGTDGQPGVWSGSALIPASYFPPNVTRMNAYAIHGVDADNTRTYEALYPAPENDPQYPAPDFHRLDLFQGMDFNLLDVPNTEYSDVWLAALGDAGHHKA
ncbi:hypothetical protein FHG87_004712 [Trinorchestia longiramus]|nr:hypothetical protein FHG87_004712 [Trinorchestia longiramus]